MASYRYVILYLFIQDKFEYARTMITLKSCKEILRMLGQFQANFCISISMFILI